MDGWMDGWMYGWMYGWMDLVRMAGFSGEDGGGSSCSGCGGFLQLIGWRQ